MTAAATTKNISGLRTGNAARPVGEATPGPRWRSHDNAVHWGGIYIGSTSTERADWREMASFLAKSADCHDDLLEACKAALDAADAHADFDAPDSKWLDLEEKANRLIRAAIAKAEGR